MLLLHLHWSTLARRLLRLDPWLLLATLFLLGVGTVTIYSTGIQSGGGFATYWQRQLLWAALGLAAYLGLALMDYRRLGRGVWFAYGAALALLVLVLLFGRSVYGSKSWLPLLGFTLQPSELAKPATLLMLAWVASRPGWRPDHLGPLLPLAAVLAIPLGLVFLQPDWGTALAFLGIAIPLCFAGGLPWRLILAGLALVAVLAPVGYLYALKPYQRDRIATFLNPARDLTDSGWSARQSMLAVSSGGLHGKGFMKGTMHVLGYLPRTVAPTDFIFSVVAEENGFIGGVVVIGAFLLIILRCLRIAALSSDEFGAYLAVGSAGLLFVHAYINIGMNMQAAPIIGIPLPLVSYGGSFVVGTMICLGLVQSVYVHNGHPPETAREEPFLLDPL
ncbi:MAG: rod shape-determining protein RodA [Lentisphaeria bacterium]|jgi:rod shape determining protein RodA